MLFQEADLGIFHRGEKCYQVEVRRAYKVHALFNQLVTKINP